MHMNKKQLIVSLLGIILSGIPIYYPIQMKIKDKLPTDKIERILVGNSYHYVPEWTPTIFISFLILLLTLVIVIFLKDKPNKNI